MIFMLSVVIMLNSHNSFCIIMPNNLYAKNILHNPISPRRPDLFQLGTASAAKRVLSHEAGPPLQG